MKTCSKCKESKYESEFHKDSKNKNGFSSHCKKCEKIRAKAKHLKDKENQNARTKIYYEVNKEKEKARAVVWAKANPEKRKAKAKRHQQANPNMYCAAANKRHAQKLNATLNLSKEEDIKIGEFYKESARLTKETGILHEVDHIIPLQGELVSGLHVPWNLRVITAEENRKKGNKLDSNI